MVTPNYFKEKMLVRFIFFTILLSCSSPYFNTFYNAEKFYESGEKKFTNDKTIWEESENYTNPELTKAIEKCAKLLTDYGDNEEENSYADDAYIMMIKSSYFLKNFHEVIKLNDLMLVKTPSSPFISEAQIYAGNAYLKLGETELARTSYQNIDNVAKNFNLIARSQIGIASIYNDEKEYEKAVKVLLSALKYEEKSEELTLVLDEDIRYEILSLLISTLNEKSDFKTVVMETNDWQKLKDSKSKETIVIDVLKAHLQHKDKDLFIGFVERVKNDGDFSINLQFLDLLELYGYYISDKLEEYDFKYNELYKELGFKYKKELNAVHIKRLQGNPDYRDSLLKIYNIQLSQVKNNKVRSELIQDIEKLSFFIRVEKTVNDAEEKIIEIESKMDTVESSSEDFKKLQNEFRVQKELVYATDFELAENFFNEKKYDRAYKYFNKFIEVSKDSSKLAVSNLYLANIFELNSETEKAKERYQYVLENFPEYQNEKELYNKLGLEIKKNNNEKLFEDFLNKYDYENIEWGKFDNEYSYVINQIDTSSEYYEKLKFVSIMLSIKHNPNNQNTITKIETFRKNHPNSIFLQEINKYPTKAISEEDLKNENKSDDEEGGIRLLTPLKDSYLAEEDAIIPVELKINANGIVKSFDIKGKRFDGFKFSVAIVVNDLKFNKADEDERIYEVKLRFTSGESIPEDGRKKNKIKIPIDEADDRPDDGKDLDRSKKKKRKILEVEDE